MLQTLGLGKDEDDLQDLYDEAIKAMFRCEAGDEEAAALVTEAGLNFHATIKRRLLAHKQRQH